MVEKVTISVKISKNIYDKTMVMMLRIRMDSEQYRWNSSSVVEHGIAGPRVTGSIPVCSFFYIIF